MQISRDTLDIRKELGLVSEFYDAAAAEKDIRLMVRVPDQVTFALDRTLFQRAIGNVVQNAMTHTGHGGEVRISANNGGSELQVIVQDNGAASLRSTFREFWTVFIVPVRHEVGSGGAGLGLAIVDSITRLHGGDVRISSQPGAGTTVTLRFCQAR